VSQAVAGCGNWFGKTSRKAGIKNIYGLQKIARDDGCERQHHGDALISQFDWSSSKLAEVYEKAN
jgi:hypothetical protein